MSDLERVRFGCCVGWRFVTPCRLLMKPRGNYTGIIKKVTDEVVLHMWPCCGPEPGALKGHGEGRILLFRSCC